GKKVRALSLKPIEKLILQKLKVPKEIKFQVLENLRYDHREETGSITFARELAKGHDLFVNDAFAASHRDHTSITYLPKVLPSVFGLQFEKELKGLAPVIHQPKRPLLIILGGAKVETKLPLIDALSQKADVIVVGGKLAAELTAHPIENRKLIVGKLTPDGFDMARLTIEQFARFISMAETVVWNGPLGKFEDPKYRNGTRTLARILTHTRAYSVVGGGDTEAALTTMKMGKGIKFISSGGGAMLEYVAHGTLPGIEAIRKQAV
ncbi:MAG TPA: phosphoglycerate kinase, partial [Patescibacteria group bacterium]|nr:phosphoglycerate kinase [Patescibacteria group bacterium]